MRTSGSPRKSSDTEVCSGCRGHRSHLVYLHPRVHIRTTPLCVTSISYVTLLKRRNWGTEEILYPVSCFMASLKGELQTNQMIFNILPSGYKLLSLLHRTTSNNHMWPGWAKWYWFSDLYTKWVADVASKPVYPLGLHYDTMTSATVTIFLTDVFYTALKME